MKENRNTETHGTVYEHADRARGDLEWNKIIKHMLLYSIFAISQKL